MKDEYDFSEAERGKFYRKDAAVEIPLYPESTVHRYFSERAAAKSVAMGELVNELLKRDIELIETVK
jgi:hypothetical protein